MVPERYLRFQWNCKQTRFEARNNMQNRTIDLLLFSEIYTNKFENVLTVGSYAEEIAITIKNKALNLWTLTWHNLEGLKNVFLVWSIFQRKYNMAYYINHIKNYILCKCGISLHEFFTLNRLLLKIMKKHRGISIHWIKVFCCERLVNKKI